MFLGAGLGPAHAAKFRVEDPDQARLLVSRGGKLVADYDSFQIVEVDDNAAVSANARVQPADRLDYINLKAGPLSTRAAAIPPLVKAQMSFTGRRLHLVQFVGPVKPEWRQALEGTGVRIVNYLPEDAYLVYGDAGALGQLQSWASGEPAVQWQGAYLANYKLPPRVRSAIQAKSLQTLGTGTFAIQLVADPAANAATSQLIDQRKVAPIRREYDLLNYHNLIVALPAEAVGEIAAQPDVVSILPWFEPRKKDERQDQIIAGNLVGNAPSGPGYLGWLASKGFSQAQFSASGFVVDVSDSGIDNGTTTPGHFGFYPGADVSQSSRVAYSRLEGVPNSPSTIQGCDGHGTLNAHVVAGYDDMTGFPHLDGSGYSYGLGVCPFVRVGSSVVFDPDFFTTPDYKTLQTQAFNDGARVSNNSWGASVGGAYDSDAQTYDTLVRDVGGGSSQRQMVIVFVAGNDATNESINSPGTAKNVITVGASENVRSLSIANGGNDSLGNDGCGDPDTSADSAADVIDFSSRGPCSDGRSKPDLVAPGTHITGGVPQEGAATTNGTGTALACFDASGVAALPGAGGCANNPTTGNPDNFFPLNQQFFTVSSGTSHAAPAVAGACALVRQYFLNQNLAAPSPAMTKAYLMNSARYLTGAYANDTLWSQSQGMGGLDLGTAFDGVSRILRDQLSSDKFVASGQRRTFSGYLADPSRPLRVTLAWTDAAGSTTAAKALINDLDLSVNVGANTYLGNVFNGPNSVTGGTADSLNNVESVFLPAGGSTNFTVTVTAANIAADALLNGASPAQQDFALVIYNAVLTNVPPYVPTADSYSGLFSQTSGAKVESSGSVALKTTTKSTFTGKLQLGPKHYGFSGRFDATGAAAASIKRGNDTPLTLNLQVDTTDNGRISGTLVGPGWVADLLAVRAVFSSKSNPAPFAGKYTLIIPGNGNPANSASPQGDGYCAITVDSSGKAKATGVLADGTRINLVANTTANSQWPVYLPLYRSGGCLVGWLNFAATPQTDLSGVVTWIKAPDFNAKAFPAGFTVQTNASGSVYLPPDNANPSMVSFASGSVTLRGGGLAGTISDNFTIGANNRILTETNNWSMNFIPAQGLFKGSATDPASGRRFSFSGAILQKQNRGSGFLVGPTGDGRVTVGP